ncbi:MAG: hypothetical protein Q8Q25_03280, partial [bacterium]|nr:hypothetical protein [bacterium]
MRYRDCLLQQTYNLALMVIVGIAGNRIAYFLGAEPAPVPGMTVVLSFCLSYLFLGSYILYKKK